jgi:hypothetical protein
MSVDSDSDGRFRITLGPGRYELRAEPLNGFPVPFARPVPITVPGDGYANVEILFDSGVRGAPV